MIERSCNMCGQCCRKIYLDPNFHETLQRHKNLGTNNEESTGIATQHWTYLGTSEELGGFSFKDHTGKVHPTFIYSCDLVTEDNKCSIHLTKPEVCTGYPYYGRGPLRNMAWPYLGCCHTPEISIGMFYSVMKEVQGAINDRS